MQFVIITGMSGAGKSTALRYLEDIGFFCVDNLPPALITKFAEVCFKTGNDIDKIALGIDIRGGVLFGDLFDCLLDSKYWGYNYEILFLEANDDVLVKRYKETRRKHPLSKNERIETGIAKERVLLTEVKLKANYIIDTSFYLTRDLKEQINAIFLLNKNFDSLVITVLSFGFKYGIPNDSDLVFDVRFIPNPFYIDELKTKTGNDKEVNDFVMSYTLSIEFLDKLCGLLEFLIPNYIKEGKNQLVISIGCTGGKHRSVTIANNLFSSLKSNNHSVIINHRDIKKE